MNIIDKIPVQELVDKKLPDAIKDFVLIRIQNGIKNLPVDMIVSKACLGSPKDQIFMDETILLIKKKGIELIKQRGRTNLFLDEHFNKVENVDRWTNYLSKDLKNDLNNPDYEWMISHRTRFSWLENGMTGEYIPEPIFLSNAKVDDTQYNLDDFAEKLLTTSGVGFLTYQSRWANQPPGILFSPVSEDAPGIGGIISDMEHHGEEGDTPPLEKEELNLFYYPSVEDLKKIVDFSKKFNNDGEFRNHTAYKDRIMNEDQFIVRKILGGDEFFKNHYVEEVIPKRKFKH